MQLSCGSKEGGWMRIADITNGDKCPTGWRQITSPVRACRGTTDSAGCFSASFSNNDIPYQHVCGKVVGYQKGTMDGFRTIAKDIDGYYVDGISLTYGKPRKHLWTYANGFNSQTSTYSDYNCPCARHPGAKPPTFVRGHYFCDSGNSGSRIFTKYYTSNPVWDGKGCTTGDSCCSQAGMPWFYRQIPVQVKESIEARICHDQSFADEGILVKDMELYVQ